MYAGFPSADAAILRCPNDAGGLALVSPSPRGGEYIRDGAFACTTCDRRYPVEDGIVRLIDAATLDAESRHEQEIRDREAAPLASSATDRAEIEPTVRALAPLSRAKVLEIGCGTGRYTFPVAEQGASILAVDFSFASLRQLAARAPAGARLALVQADATRLPLDPRAFDRALSTLVSNLPSAEHRAAMFRHVARALGPGGRFVLSAHHYTLRDRLRRTPASGRYQEGHIFRYLFRERELVAETRRSFDDVRSSAMQVWAPGLGRLGLGAVALPSFAGSVPLVKLLGDLLLLVAERPHP